MADKKQIGMIFHMPEDVAQKIADGIPLTDNERRFFSYQLRDQRNFPFYLDDIWWVSLDEFANNSFPEKDEPVFLEMRDGSIKAGTYWEDKNRYFGFNGASEINLDDVVRIGRLTALDREERQSIYRWD